MPVVLVHALGIKYLEQMQHGMAYFIEPYLKKQKERLEAEGFQTAAELALGPAVVEVHRIAAEHRASLIVVGSHGASVAREILLGGTALGIVSHATLPVGRALRNAAGCSRSERSGRSRLGRLDRVALLLIGQDASAHDPWERNNDLAVHPKRGDLAVRRGAVHRLRSLRRSLPARGVCDGRQAGADRSPRCLYGMRRLCQELSGDGRFGRRGRGLRRRRSDRCV